MHLQLNSVRQRDYMLLEEGKGFNLPGLRCLLRLVLIHLADYRSLVAEPPKDVVLHEQEEVKEGRKFLK